MLRRVWLASAYYNTQTCIQWVLHPYKFTEMANKDAISRLKQQGYSAANNQGLRLITTNAGILRRRMDSNIRKEKLEEKGKSIPPAAGSSPPRFNLSIWAKCLLGSVLSFIVPFWKEKWTKWKAIEGEAEMVVEEVESVAEVVEKVAAVTEKVSANVAENLPDDSKLKNAALVVESISEKAIQDAHATAHFIHQVEELKHEVVDGLVQPIVNDIINQATK